VLKNVTITADEKVLKWARHEAIEKGISLSKLVSQILEEQMRQKDDYWQAFERWKKIKPVPFKEPIGKIDREKIHERGR
jgi:hypothetical protein